MSILILEVVWLLSCLPCEQLPEACKLWLVMCPRQRSAGRLLHVAAPMRRWRKRWQRRKERVSVGEGGGGRDLSV